jgi:hypothetical protein
MRAILCACVVLAACGSNVRPGGNGLPDGGGGTDSNGNGSGSGSGSNGEQVYVYAQTDTTLYRVDPDTLAITKIGDFAWPSSVGSDQMTDIAIDKNGQMIGVSFTRVYRVDPSNAACTLLSSSLGGTFNGLSFVPATMLGMTGDDVLVGTENNDGKVFKIDPMTGATTQVGSMGGSFVSSGDLVAVEGFGTVQTVTGASSDVLATLAPQTFAATAVGSGTGFGMIWGVAFWKDKIYGFTDGGDFILIDPMTGVATRVTSTGQAWWGAAVTTLAPVLQ